MYIERHITGYLNKMLTKFPVLSLTGPRQSGKTTLLKKEFGQFRYFSLERIDHREMVASDPNGFLERMGSGVIFDEAQRFPELFNYIQVISDERGTPGQYILSGSQSFLLSEKISQSLAGRVSINHLFPFDFSEIRPTDQQSIGQFIINGFYPRLYDREIQASDFYPSYIQTYIERDVRTLRTVENLGVFTRFLGLCAGRIGQILNLTSLANDAGVSVNTAKAWLSLLESSYILFLLQPYYRNFNKRLVKSPKIFFYDTGVAASLLKITQPEMVPMHYMVGSLFENMVISDIVKSQSHLGNSFSIWYWRESNGVEIDCILEMKDILYVIEIKSGQTFNNDYLRNLKLFPAVNLQQTMKKMVVYGGDISTQINDIQLIPWKDFLTGHPADLKI